MAKKTVKKLTQKKTSNKSKKNQSYQSISPKFMTCYFSEESFKWFPSENEKKLYEKKDDVWESHLNKPIKGIHESLLNIKYFKSFIKDNNVFNDNKEKKFDKRKLISDPSNRSTNLKEDHFWMGYTQLNKFKDLQLYLLINRDHFRVSIGPGQEINEIVMETISNSLEDEEKKNRIKDLIKLIRKKIEQKDIKGELIFYETKNDGKTYLSLDPEKKYSEDDFLSPVNWTKQSKKKFAMGIVYSKDFFDSKEEFYLIEDIKKYLGELVNIWMILKGINKKLELNTIFYGVPGTGKTHDAIEEAVKIITGMSQEEINALKKENNFQKKVAELKKKELLHFITFHPGYSYEYFIEGIFPEIVAKNVSYKYTDGILKDIVKKILKDHLKNDIKKISVENYENLKAIDKKNNYVLIIDEINRGNIPAIFGELISLVEDSKRIKFKDEIEACKKDEGLVVQLPLSGDYFSIPSNLYIIGTMNSTDKSIESLDIALRRRFDLKRKDPVYYDKLNKRFKDFLKKMNKSITFFKSKDFQIGHTFLLEVETDQDFTNVFNNKIAPLLEEYFFGEMEKLKYILNDDYLEKSSLPKNLAESDFEEDEEEKIIGIKRGLININDLLK
jgi:hypothetical protein